MGRRIARKLATNWVTKKNRDRLFMLDYSNSWGYFFGKQKSMNSGI
jgi:hypothetical protein